MKHKLIFTSFLLLGTGILYNVNASGLNISPISNEVLIQPGATAPGSFLVKNQESQTINLQFETVEFNPSGDLKSEAPSNIILPVSQVSLQPGEQKSINYEISQPVVSAYGSQYLGIQVKVVSAGGNQNGSSVIASATYRINVKFVNNNIGQPEIYFSNVSIPKFVISNNTTLTYDLLNGTSYYVAPILYNQIVNPAGEIIYTSVINDGKNLLTNGNKLSGNISLTTEMQTVTGIYTFEVLAADQPSNTSEILKMSVLIVTPDVLVVSIIVILLTIAAIAGVISIRKKFSKKKKRT